MQLKEYQASANYILEKAKIIGKTAVVLGSGFGVLSQKLKDSQNAACVEIP